VNLLPWLGRVQGAVPTPRYFLKPMDRRASRASEWSSLSVSTTMRTTFGLLPIPHTLRAGLAARSASPDPQIDPRAEGRYPPSRSVPPSQLSVIDGTWS